LLALTSSLFSKNTRLIKNFRTKFKNSQALAEEQSLKFSIKVVNKTATSAAQLAHAYLRTTAVPSCASTNKNFNLKIKSSFYSLNTLSGVMSEQCPSPRLCARVHTIKVATVASRWQRVEDLICLGFEAHISRTRGRRLTTCI